MAIAVDTPPRCAESARALPATSSSHTSGGLPNRALVTLLWRVGLRSGEALTVGAPDVDGESGVITLPSRPAGIDRLAARVIVGWTQRRAGLGRSTDGPFISMLAGSPLGQAYIRELPSRLAERAGRTLRVRPIGRGGLLTEVSQPRRGDHPQSATGRCLPRANLAEMVRALQARPIPG